MAHKRLHQLQHRVANTYSAPVDTQQCNVFDVLCATGRPACREPPRTRPDDRVVVPVVADWGNFLPVVTAERVAGPVATTESHAAVGGRGLSNQLHALLRATYIFIF